ncbi:MAG: hypothetical protein AAF244_01295 [Pseudomonadota bacterium]
MRNEFLEVSNADILRMTEDKKFFLTCYVDALHAGQSDKVVELYDGSKVEFDGEVDLSKPYVRKIFERADLLIARDLYDAAREKGMLNALIQLWGARIVGAVLSVEPHGAANSNYQPVLGRN